MVAQLLSAILLNPRSAATSKKFDSFYDLDIVKNKAMNDKIKKLGNAKFID